LSARAALTWVNSFATDVLDIGADAASMITGIDHAAPFTTLGLGPLTCSPLL